MTTDRFRTFACLLALLVGLASATRADEGLGGKLETVRGQLVELARAVREQEAHVTRAEHRLAELRRRQEDRETQFRRMQGRLADLAMALQRLARRAPGAVVTTPHSPLDSARALSLISSLTPGIQRQTAALGAEVDDLAELRRAITREQARLRIAESELQRQRSRLDRLIGQKTVALQLDRARSGVPLVAGPEIRETVQTLDELHAALKAASGQQRDAVLKLQSLLARVPQAPGGQRPDEVAARDAALTVPEVPGTGEAVRARFTFPVAGDVVTGFGDADGQHMKSRGITVAVRPGARVVAPNDGTVVFADEFRGYGRMVIIEHDGGLHSLLSPLGRVDVRAQQMVFAGEPVGVMGRSAQREERLYVELWRDGTPVDPLFWIPVGKETVPQ